MSEALNEDLKKPEGISEILGDGTEEREDKKPRREEISDELADLATGGTIRVYGGSERRFNLKRKRKKDDILLPEI